ncbi:hypothetical protein Bcep1808_5180 [Burkholderia vietnamiensis G4]|uniref:Uncharacterized protein n=1 Tax=Burkholderia vietnamiensis (strain G4 / LMG 22486) TaxID=269482 RepID=A4JPC7_BURVG|nr:hypothetical protein Bcep1808_5180 [Burkholderia vietnamiensis G4]
MRAGKRLCRYGKVRGRLRRFRDAGKTRRERRFRDACKRRRIFQALVISLTRGRSSFIGRVDAGLRVAGHGSRPVGRQARGFRRLACLSRLQHFVGEPIGGNGALRFIVGDGRHVATGIARQQSLQCRGCEKIAQIGHRLLLRLRRRHVDRRRGLPEGGRRLGGFRYGSGFSDAHILGRRRHFFPFDRISVRETT